MDAHKKDAATSRVRHLSKCLYAWDVDKRSGHIPADELSRIFVTNTGERSVELCRQWVLMLTRTFHVTASLKSQKGAALTADTLVQCISQDLAADPLLSGPLGGRVEWAKHIDIQQCALSGADSEGDIAAEAELGCGPRRKFSISLKALTPNRLVDAEITLQKALSEPGSVVQKRARVIEVEHTEGKVLPKGLTKNEARSVILEITQCLNNEQFEAFVQHILVTLDFVYDASHSNTRNRMLFETFKLWDVKDHGFIDAAEFSRRMTTMKYAQDTGNTVQRILDSEGLSQSEPSVQELSLTGFKHIMNKIFSGCSEADADEILRSLKRQLTGDEDASELRYTSCRHLRSEAERLQKRDERLAQMSERKSSFSSSLRENTVVEMSQYKIKRLESALRHAFDSVALDDITTLLDASVVPAAARQMSSRVATATCILLDMTPVLVEGRADYWTTLVEGLRSSMVDVLYALHDFNRANLSYVRICKCMAALEEHAYPSHVLTYSWFLSSLSEWCRTVCELVCVESKWEWPPVPIQSTDSGSGSGLDAGRSTCMPRPPSAPMGGTALSSRSKLSRSAHGSRSARSAKQADHYTIPRGAVPESPFRANNLFLRRRTSKSDTYHQFMDKVMQTERQQREAVDLVPADMVDSRSGAMVNTANPNKYLTEKELVTYHEMHDLNESLGLPQPPFTSYTASQPSAVCCPLCASSTTPSQMSRPYWVGS